MVLFYGCAVVEVDPGNASECSRISDLSRSGEHKPAVDAADKLGNAGSVCSDAVQTLVETSRVKIERADAFVHKALKRKKESNLLSAEANLELALETYPKYYWARKLLKDIRQSIDSEVSSLLSEALYLETRGDLLGALTRLKEAGNLSPEDKALQSEIARLQAGVKRSQELSMVEELIGIAKALLEEGGIDEAERILAEAGQAGSLGKEGEELLRQVRIRKSDIIDQRLNVAVEAEQRGDLAVAAGHLSYVLGFEMNEGPRTTQTVEFARLLGMKLYSAGMLSMARDIWILAQKHDPGNDKLRTYIQEVNLRLEKLEMLKNEKNEKEKQ